MNSKELNLERYMPTTQHGFIKYFVCKLCTFIVRDPVQCKNDNCSILYCKECVNNKMSSWKCLECFDKKKPNDIHRKVKNFMENL